MSSHFVDDVVATEQKAQALVEAAQEKKEKDLLDFGKKEKAAYQEKLDKARDDQKEKLKESQKGMKKLHDDLLQEAETEQKKMAENAESQMDSTLVSAESYLFQTLMGIPA